MPRIALKQQLAIRIFLLAGRRAARPDVRLPFYQGVARKAPAFMPGMDSAEAEGFLSIDSGSIVIA